MDVGLDGRRRRGRPGRGVAGVVVVVPIRRLFRARVRSVEDKFPEASEFQKYADSNQLFLAYQLGELTKRLERVERGQLGRLQVIGIVITTLITAVAVAGGIVLLLPCRANPPMIGTCRLPAATNSSATVAPAEAWRPTRRPAPPLSPS